MAQGKRYKKAAASINRALAHDFKKAVELVKTNATAKFDESFEVAMNLGVDPRKADQLVRGTVALPHGTGKSVRVLVVAKGPKDKEALDAGADYAGFSEYIEKLQGGWADIDIIIATPDVMGEVGKLGRVLGPRGLMPNPKSGTVTFDVAKAVAEVKAGKIEFRVDKAGNIHASVGKCSFDVNKLVDNVQLFVGTVIRAKPSSAKGKYVKSISFSSTMGPSVRVDEQSLGADL
ncbi:MAG: 50S ribosomal protein L1 [Ignavibacteria bacterium]|nr:50S ribosomal protein L1 [Ignavibacteria bacterium]MBP6508964.1 50S ribosomal protein L1 [Candidatus Kapabacteria bacterium]MBK6419426.1 50S ribosomal protein L1 [Ignavibacteria bacterium]MBK6759945.1 50S ribosomal protein L1 [Ignavibacteria bacterium]MBK7032860.1 50S ribosomal protein L1 [Ignavibacteria bacterium]